MTCSRKINYFSCDSNYSLRHLFHRLVSCIWCTVNSVQFCTYCFCTWPSRWRSTFGRWTWDGNSQKYPSGRTVYKLFTCSSEQVPVNYLGKSHSKNKTPFWGVLYLSWVWNQNEGSMYFGCFSRKVYVQPYHWKDPGESYPLMWLNIGLRWEITKIRSIPVLISYPKQI